MAGKKNKKSKGEEEAKAGAPLWMVTFGDLMSLLLTFFVLMLSFSSIQEVEFQKALGSLKGALGVLPKQDAIYSVIKSKLPSLVKKGTKKKLKEMMVELEKLLKESKLEDNVQLELMDNGILVRIDSPVLFSLGKADLKTQNIPILNKIVEMTVSWSNSIRIEGHTDNLPINTSEFPSNWELSTARALSVLRYFLKSDKIDPGRLAAVGYGEYHPIKLNNSIDNRAKNRRVEIYIEPQKEPIDLSDKPAINTLGSEKSFQNKADSLHN